MFLSFHNYDLLIMNFLKAFYIKLGVVIEYSCHVLTFLLANFHFVFINNIFYLERNSYNTMKCMVIIVEFIEFSYCPKGLPMPGYFTGQTGAQDLSWANSGEVKVFVQVAAV